jgi:drug/metabolite transporter (DMT)-like permease
MLFAVIVANLVTQCGFGLTPVVIKKFAALSGANPLIFCLYRDSLAFPVFLLVSRVMERKLIFPSLAQIPVLFALGFFGSYGNQFLYILGLYNSNPNIASTFGNTLPAWAVLLGILVKLEPFDSKTLYSWVKIVSIIGAAAGAVEITLTSGLTGGGEGIAEEEFSTARNASEARPYSHLVLGCFLLLFSAFCMVSGLVLWVYVFHIYSVVAVVHVDRGTVTSAVAHQGHTAYIYIHTVRMY